jgi:NAD(P)-dependent dehydrogenase (short-subunit alcohol dehydrogenase family)
VRSTARRGYSPATSASAPSPSTSSHDTVARHGRLDRARQQCRRSPKHKQIYHLSADEAEHVMRFNFLSVPVTSFAAIPHMLRQGGGTIVNISSFAALVVPGARGDLRGLESAMNAFTEGLWHDLAGLEHPRAIVNPGPIDTRSGRRATSPSSTTARSTRPRSSRRDLRGDREAPPRGHVPTRNPMLVTARFLRLSCAGAPPLRDGAHGPGARGGDRAGAGEGARAKT